MNASIMSSRVSVIGIRGKEKERYMNRGPEMGIRWMRPRCEMYVETWKKKDGQNLRRNQIQC